MIGRLLYFIALYLLSLSAFSQAYESFVVDPMPEGVSNNAVVGATVNDTFYVYSFAGIDNSKLWSGIHLRSYRYNTVSGIWDTLSDLPDTLGKIAAGASLVGDTIYIIGGYYVYQNGNEATSAHVHRFNIKTNSYMSDGAPMPVPVDDQVQVVYKDSLIILATGWSNVTNVPDVQVYDPHSNSWTAATSMPNTNSYKSFGASGAIVGDTIFYFGGAQSSGSFPPQFGLRKGVIDPSDPSQISWSFDYFDMAVRGYRMASFSTEDGYVHWIGGSYQTYNYNGFAYNGSGGVPPIDRNLIFEPQTGRWEEEYSYSYPMDLRGIAQQNDSILFLAGGMGPNQQVSDSCWRLELRPFQFNSISDKILDLQLTIYPNPSEGWVRISGLNEVDQLMIYRTQGTSIPVDYQLDKVIELNLNPGYYILIARSKDRMVRKAIIISE